MDELKRNTFKCPECKVYFHWKQIHGMRLVEEVIPEKPKRPYMVYEAKCPKCKIHYKVKK